VLSSNIARIEGIVTDDRLQPVPGVQAVLVPDRNRDRTELFRAVTTDRPGASVMGGVAPGDYKLFAWEGLENFGYFDAELVEAIRAVRQARSCRRIGEDHNRDEAYRPKLSVTDVKLEGTAVRTTPCSHLAK
jgi:small ligand-binding sensory domain FIST